MARPTDKRWKGILIDWPTIADMDSEDYELKPLNQQQVAILLALLEYQKWPTRWTGLEMEKSELETYIADIEQRLMRNEGTDMATKDDIRDGMYEAMNRLALQIVTGQYADVSLSTDEDGTVTPTPEGGTIDPIEDDPTTELNEAKAAKYGGTYAIRININKVLVKIADCYNATTPAISAAQAAEKLELLYGFEAAAALSFANYYYTVDPSPITIISIAATLDSYLYCRGVSAQVFAQYSEDVHAVVAERPTLLQLATCLSPTVLSFWYNQGVLVPSSDYAIASCEPVPDETGQINLSGGGGSFISIVAQKAKHRLLCRVSGQGTDAAVAGVVIDFFYRKNADGSIVRESGIGYITGAGITSGTNPSNAQIPYQTDGSYEFTLDTTAAGALTWLRDNGSLTVTTVGLITIIVKDLGEILS